MQTKDLRTELSISPREIQVLTVTRRCIMRGRGTRKPRKPRRPIFRVIFIAFLPAETVGIHYLAWRQELWLAIPSQPKCASYDSAVSRPHFYLPSLGIDTE